MAMTHETIETKVGWMLVLTVLAVSFGGLAQIVPPQLDALEEIILG